MSKKKTNEEEDSSKVVGKKNNSVRHFLQHFIHHKKSLDAAIASKADVNIALVLGALDCLYWQSMGFGHVRLAIRISRFIRNSYPHHNVILKSHS